tara:strand:+ start:200 stop:748 length:549 start_codon:yes stop_codon:yes gene_type:complete
MVRIETVSINFPKACIKQIFNILMSQTRWTFAMDNSIGENNFVESLSNNKSTDKGFGHTSYNFKDNENQSPQLNMYANFIFEMIREQSKQFKFCDIQRIFWNYYHPNSHSVFHQDTHNPNWNSIVYNLHDNSGGTEFILENGESHIIKSVQNQAIIFPSSIKHRGLAPKKDACRFSLNIIVN